MGIKNCVICGKVFNYNGFLEVCTKCSEEEAENFDKVKDYLYEHQNASAIEVSERTGVSMKFIQRYLREERIIAVNNTNSYFLDCKICKKPINSGLYCESCNNDMKKMKGKNKRR